MMYFLRRRFDGKVFEPENGNVISGLYAQMYQILLNEEECLERKRMNALWDIASYMMSDERCHKHIVSV